MRLPIIQTCGRCGYVDANPTIPIVDGRFDVCTNPNAPPMSPEEERVDARKPPPSWCPLRTGPDEAELEALRAVAEAARAYRSKRTGAGPLDIAIAALRRLDEVRRG